MSSLPPPPPLPPPLHKAIVDVQRLQAYNGLFTQGICGGRATHTQQKFRGVWEEDGCCPHHCRQTTDDNLGSWDEGNLRRLINVFLVARFPPPWTWKRATYHWWHHLLQIWGTPSPYTGPRGSTCIVLRWDWICKTSWHNRRQGGRGAPNIGCGSSFRGGNHDV